MELMDLLESVLLPSVGPPSAEYRGITRVKGAVLHS